MDFFWWWAGRGVRRKGIYKLSLCDEPTEEVKKSEENEQQKEDTMKEETMQVDEKKNDEGIEVKIPKEDHESPKKQRKKIGKKRIKDKVQFLKKFQ